MRGGMDFVRQMDAGDAKDTESTPRRIAEFAAQRVNEQLGIAGASTLCVLGVDSNRELSAFNLGDSAFCIYRGDVDAGAEANAETEPNAAYDLIYRSAPQEQGFGVP